MPVSAWLQPNHPGITFCPPSLPPLLTCLSLGERRWVLGLRRETFSTTTQFMTIRVATVITKSRYLEAGGEKQRVGRAASRGHPTMQAGSHSLANEGDAE